MRDMKAKTSGDESLLPAPLLLVEDDPLMQERLRGALCSLGYTDEALLFASNLTEARVLYAREPCAMALVDIHLPDGSGIELIREWRKDGALLPIVVISAWSVGSVIVQALQAGATGYVLKERDNTEIAQSIRSALRGGAPIDPFIAHHILALVARPASSPKLSGETLTARQLEILKLVSKGMTNREIGEKLSLSSLTIEDHTKNIYERLAVRSRTEAVFVAREHGLL
jgi:DNA-binding NarL/FixJ family response regulator